MIVRLLALIGVVYLVAKGTRLWLSAARAGRRVASNGGEPSRIDDVMVKDPYCQVYFPKRDALRVHFQGEDLYFCSEACRDKFLELHR